MGVGTPVRPRMRHTATTHPPGRAENFVAQIWHRFVTGGMARLEGFEPPTNGFGSHYSIRLSYRRVAGHCPRSRPRARASVPATRGPCYR